MIKITLNLTIDEVNVVLSALSNRPYREVADLIAKIKADGDEQFLASQEREE